PLSAAFTARSNSSTVTIRSVLPSKKEHSSTGRLPRAMLMPRTSSSTVTELPPSQSPAHLVNVQFASQPSPSTWLASSHCSGKVTIPSPQRVQALVHPSRSLVFPSSHSSGTVTTPSPQVVHAFVQPSKGFRLPSSHCSPAVTMPLPQAVRVQFESQPSPSTRFPSSHCSTPGFRKPSPQTLRMQVLVQASLLSLFPSSHCSPQAKFVTPSPQTRPTSI